MNLEPLRERFPTQGWFACPESEQDFSIFELVPQITGIIVRHSNGIHAAIKVRHSDLGERVAVWDIITEKLIWQQAGTTALCWTTVGQELVSIRRGPRSGTDLGIRPRDYAWFFERWSWPDKKRIAASEIQPDGFVYDVAISPRRDLAAFLWNGAQDGCGIELVSVTDSDALQLSGKGYGVRRAFMSTSVTVPPVFSADGVYMVFGVEDDSQARHAEFFAGLFVFLDTATLEYHEIDIVDDLPVGWRSRVIETVEELDLYRRAKQRAMMPTEDIEGQALLSELYQREWG